MCSFPHSKCLIDILRCVPYGHRRHSAIAFSLYMAQRSKAQIPLGSTRLDSTRLDTFDFVEPVEPVEQVETSVSSSSNMADDERSSNQIKSNQTIL